MMIGDDFKYSFGRFLRDLLIALMVVGMWLFCIMRCKAQTVPLVRVCHDAFVSYYDIQTHCPALVVYQLEWRHFSGSSKVAGRHFKMDTKLPRPRVKDCDYSGTGFVRGHLCSAGDRDSNYAWLKQTYLTSNLVPMTMVCNSGAYKAIEDSCRRLAIAGHRLLIARGPLYKYPRWDPDDVLHTAVDIVVPLGFFSFARCIDCGLCSDQVCYNAAAGDTWYVIQSRLAAPERTTKFMNDPRVSVLLQNIIGLWSREEYETITR